MSAAIVLNKKNIWCFDSVCNEASKYKNKTEFKKNVRGAFNWAVRNNLLDEVSKNLSNNLTLWSLELCILDAKKYSTRSEYQRLSISSYRWASRNNKLDIVCSHMESGYSGFNPKKPAILYYVQVDSNLFKIGITNRTVKERFGSDFHKIKIISQTHFLLGSDAAKIEKEILHKFKDFRYFGKPILKSGNSELFTKDIFFNYYK